MGGGGEMGVRGPGFPRGDRLRGDRLRRPSWQPPLPSNARAGGARSTARRGGGLSAPPPGRGWLLHRPVPGAYCNHAPCEGVGSTFGPRGWRQTRGRPGPAPPRCPPGSSSTRPGPERAAPGSNRATRSSPRRPGPPGSRSRRSWRRRGAACRSAARARLGQGRARRLTWWRCRAPERVCRTLSQWRACAVAAALVRGSGHPLSWCRPRAARAARPSVAAAGAPCPFPECKCGERLSQRAALRRTSHINPARLARVSGGGTAGLHRYLPALCSHTFNQILCTKPEPPC
jgi:hypothetical protein